MCKSMQYPPRFILDVDGHKAIRSITAKIEFPGAKETFKRTTPCSAVKLTFQGVVTMIYI